MDDLLTEEDVVFRPVDEVAAEDDVNEAASPSRIDAARTLVFTTLTLLSLLCVASHIHVDGTFKVCFSRS